MERCEIIDGMKELSEKLSWLWDDFEYYFNDAKDRGDLALLESCMDKISVMKDEVDGYVEKYEALQCQNAKRLTDKEEVERRIVTLPDEQYVELINAYLRFIHMPGCQIYKNTEENICKRLEGISPWKLVGMNGYHKEDTWFYYGNLGLQSSTSPRLLVRLIGLVAHDLACEYVQQSLDEELDQKVTILLATPAKQ